jgi:hypothetical protein
MTTIPTIENEARARILAADALLAKSRHPESGLFKEQRLCCANHSDEEIILDKIGWNNFICPKCGSDYSIGRKVIVLDPKPAQRSIFNSHKI